MVAAAVLATPAASLGADRTEQRVTSAAPDARQVTESYVRVKAPLPASAGAHPEACDWVSYLRFRNAGGPRNPSDADAVITAMPGFLSGAGPFDQLARNFVRTWTPAARTWSSGRSTAGRTASRTTAGCGPPPAPATRPSPSTTTGAGGPWTG